MTGSLSMLVRTSLLAVSLSVLLGGCVSFKREELRPAETQIKLDARTLRDPGLERFLATHGQSHSEEWDLARVTLAAFYFNPDLDLARAQFAEATAGVRAAAALPNPSVNFTPGYDKDSFPGVTPWILGYALNLPVELAGKRRFRTAEAQRQVEAAQFRLTASAWAIRSAVRQALIALHAAEDTAILWSSEKPLLAQIASLLEAQTQAGELSVFEAAQPRMAAHRAELAQRES